MKLGEDVYIVHSNHHVKKLALLGLPKKKILQGKKFFEIDIFVLKHVLEHSKSILTEKNFENFFDSFGHFWPKNFKVKVDALPHLLTYGHETFCGR